MGSILITGLTGNVGREVANSLKQREVGFVCGV
jgi:nucleoside-diphosphate-sugar epimerase